jgi:hypothetical protein
MKHFITLTCLMLATVANLQAQKFKDLDVSPLDIIEYPGSRGEAQWARILYSRPQLKGRAIESLVPEGKIWRMGANESTELTLYVPMKVGTTSVDAGVYTLYALPSENELTLIINKATHVWGAYGYDQNLDVARITVPVTEGNDSLEAFSMVFEDGGNETVNLHLGWEKQRATVQFSK